MEGGAALASPTQDQALLGRLLRVVELANFGVVTLHPYGTRQPLAALPVVGAPAALAADAGGSDGGRRRPW